MNINLDAARAARAETLGEKHTLTIDGKTLPLRAELPVDFAMLLSEGNWREALAVLMGAEGSATFLAAHPSDEDLGELWRQLAAVYGLGDRAGGSQASGTSSPARGRSSRPTSGASTRSTSGRSASARKQKV